MAIKAEELLKSKITVFNKETRYYKTINETVQADDPVTGKFILLVNLIHISSKLSSRKRVQQDIYTDGETKNIPIGDSKSVLSVHIRLTNIEEALFLKDVLDDVTYVDSKADDSGVATLFGGKVIIKVPKFQLDFVDKFYGHYIDLRAESYIFTQSESAVGYVDININFLVNRIGETPINIPHIPPNLTDNTNLDFSESLLKLYQDTKDGYTKMLKEVNDVLDKIDDGISVITKGIEAVNDFKKQLTNLKNRIVGIMFTAQLLPTLIKQSIEGFADLTDIPDSLFDNIKNLNFGSKKSSVSPSTQQLLEEGARNNFIDMMNNITTAVVSERFLQMDFLTRDKALEALDVINEKIDSSSLNNQEKIKFKMIC